MIIGVDGSSIDELWLAEFRGFFFGEGHLGITSWGKPKKGFRSFVARVQITARSDDAALLFDIQSKLGGTVYHELPSRLSPGTGSSSIKSYRSNPVTIWRLTRADDIRRLCDVLAPGKLPSKKLREVEIMREFLETVQPAGKKPTLEQRALRSRLNDRIKSLHRYLGS